MANILYLVHRIPYPPNKGDKVRSYHLLRHLLQNHRVFLGTFLDDPEDEVHVATLQAMCPDLHIERIQPRLARARSLKGFLSGDALSLAYYDRSAMHRWVQRTLEQHRMDASVVFSSVMAQYAQPLLPGVPMVVDFVDVDSAKWSEYAPAHRWPMSAVYRREGARLLAYERAVAAQASRSFFVTPNETALFLGKAPEVADRVQSLSNGVNADFFAPVPNRVNPFPVEELAVVFTGAMDYWPNIDGVRWFVDDMLAQLRISNPRVRFYVVGRSPSPQVQALASDHVVVTGTVPDVRPYLQHAAVVVAPLRVARGIQNKILEAMAMEQPVITVSSCADAIGADADQGLLRADTPADFVQAVQQLLSQPESAKVVGAAARRYVLNHYSWEAHLKGIDAYLPSAVAPGGTHE